MSLLAALNEALGRPEVARAIGAASLVSARLLPLAFFAPVFGLRSASALVRSGLVLGLAAVLTPLAFVNASLPPPATMPLAIVRESFIGAIFALTASVPFFALESGGRLVDLYRGANLAEVLAPPTGDRTSPLGDLALLGGLALFASAGGLRLTVGAFAASLIDLPVGATSADANGFLGAARTLASAMDFAAVAAAPAAVAILVVDVALGLTARTVPRISIFFVGMPIRALLGLVFALLTIGLVLREGVDQAGDAIRLASRLLR